MLGAVRTPVDRVSATDLVSLASDTGPTPMQVAAVLVFAAGLDPAAVEAAIARRIVTVPRLRQRLVRVPPGLGRPVWVDDASFKVSRHLDRTSCPPPGDEPALLDLAAALATRRLPRSRPLWSATLVTGLADGRAALIMVFHHVLADGIGGLAILASLVDGVPGAPLSPFPAQAPTHRELAADAWRSRLAALSRLPRLGSIVRPALTELAGRPALVERCSLNRPTGPRRRLAVVRADLAHVRAAAHRCSATVNDALLAAIVGALRTLLAARGERIETITVSMPVAARRATTAAHLGNSVGVRPVALPTAGATVSRLARIAPITKAQKSVVPGASAALTDPVIRALGALGLVNRVVNRQRLVHTFVTNLRGPEQPVTIGGATVEAVIPISATMGNVALAFAALSYAGTLSVTVVADPDHVPDLAVLAEALQAELDTLTCS